MYREIPEMTEQQRFDQYRTELECVIEIAALHRDEYSQRACNRLAEHVRQQAKISANAEHAILLIEQATRERDAIRKKYATAFEGLSKIMQGVEDPQQVAAAYAQTCVDS